jgi:transposase
MVRAEFGREFEFQAVMLVRDRGVTVAEACRDLDLAESVLRRWVHEAKVAPVGSGAMCSMTGWPGGCTGSGA